MGPISWSSKRQGIIALLSTEAEYIAETHAVKEGIWLKSFVKEIVEKEGGAFTIMADNQGAISLAKDNKFHAHTKHIDLQYHFVHEVVEDEKIKMIHMYLWQRTQQTSSQKHYQNPDLSSLLGS